METICLDLCLLWIGAVLANADTDLAKIRIDLFLVMVFQLSVRLCRRWRSCGCE